jgi:hypothetical protein
MPLPQRLQVDGGGRELLQVLRAAQLRGLLSSCSLVMLLAQRLQAALEAPALLVGRRAAWPLRSSYSLRAAPAPARARA